MVVFLEVFQFYLYNNSDRLRLDSTLTTFLADDVMSVKSTVYSNI